MSDIYPYPLPDLFAGTQVVVAGRYRNGGPTTVTIKGTVNGTPQSYRYGDLILKEAGGMISFRGCGRRARLDIC